MAKNIRSVFITGANRGLGLEFVKQFAALSGAPKHIFAVCRNPDTANELQDMAKSNSSIQILRADMKDFKSFPTIVRRVEEKVGDAGLNLLINNAGIMFHDGLDDLCPEHLMENFEVNVVAPLLLSKEFIPLLTKATYESSENTLSCHRAAIVNITSKMGSIDDNTSGGCYPYRISKTALNMATKSLAVDLKSQGILVFALHPGWVLTDMGGKSALINTETSVTGMLDVILKSNGKDAGLMIGYDGKHIPW